MNCVKLEEKGDVYKVCILVQRIKFKTLQCCYKFMKSAIRIKQYKCKQKWELHFFSGLQSSLITSCIYRDHLCAENC